MKSFQATSVEQLQNRWKQLFEQVDNPVIVSSVLDPRFRRLKFMSPEQIITVETKALAAKKGDGAAAAANHHLSCKNRS